MAYPPASSGRADPPDADPLPAADVRGRSVDGAENQAEAVAVAARSGAVVLRRSEHLLAEHCVVDDCLGAEILGDLDPADVPAGVVGHECVVVAGVADLLRVTAVGEVHVAVLGGVNEASVGRDVGRDLVRRDVDRLVAVVDRRPGRVADLTLAESVGEHGVVVAAAAEWQHRHE